MVRSLAFSLARAASEEGLSARHRGDPDGTSEAFRHTKYPNYATERSHWHLNAWRGPKAMDSLLADWFSTGRDLVWARVT